MDYSNKLSTEQKQIHYSNVVGIVAAIVLLIVIAMAYIDTTSVFASSRPQLSATLNKAGVANTLTSAGILRLSRGYDGMTIGYNYLNITLNDGSTFLIQDFKEWRNENGSPRRYMLVVNDKGIDYIGEEPGIYETKKDFISNIYSDIDLVITEIERRNSAKKTWLINTEKNL